MILFKKILVGSSLVTLFLSSVFAGGPPCPPDTENNACAAAAYRSSNFVLGLNEVIDMTHKPHSLSDIRNKMTSTLQAYTQNNHAQFREPCLSDFIQNNTSPVTSASVFTKSGDDRYQLTGKVTSGVLGDLQKCIETSEETGS